MPHLHSSCNCIPAPGLHMSPFVLPLLRFYLRLMRPAGKRNFRLLRERGEDLGRFFIRQGRMEDVEQLVEIHVTTWNQTYPLVLKKPTPALREYQWRKQFNGEDAGWFCYVVDNGNGKLAGFVTGSRYNISEDLPFEGELNKIYLRSSYQRLGLGKKLMYTAALHFRSMNINSMILFAAPENPSCRFYEELGGERIYKDGNFHGAYCWKDLQQLAAAADRI